LSSKAALTIAALGVVCLGAAPPASASHVHMATCGVSADRTVVADSAARVYRAAAGHGQLGPVYNYYACAIGGANSHLLARSASAVAGARLFPCGDRGCEVVRAIRLAGATVGVIVEHHGLDSVTSTLTVREAASGQALHAVQTYAVVGAGTLIGGELLVRYVLAPSGNIAWATVCEGEDACRPRQPQPTREGIIHRAIAHVVSTLDAGPAVLASSLRLHGGEIEWIDGGVERTAPLP